jgi:hypothetical protein
MPRLTLLRLSSCKCLRMGNGMTMINTSQARLMPPRAKYMDNASMQVPSTLGSHSAETNLVSLATNTKASR